MANMKRIGIIGSRHFKDYSKFYEIVKDCFHELGHPLDIANCHEQFIIVTGDMTGVDALARMFAQNLDMLYVTFHALAAARTMKNSAFGIRTRMVVDYSDSLIAIPEVQSKGTRNGIVHATARMIPTVVREVVRDY